jgi:hypothetical protein
MNYIRPTYDVQTVETSDIMLVSLGDGVTLTETAEGNAKVSASVLDVLGLR